MTSLKIINGPQTGRVFELARGIATLGRDQTNSIQVLDFEISRRHAEIHFRGDEFWVFDLESSNGTYLNGQRVESSRLNENDQIRVGQTTLEFHSRLISDSGIILDRNQDETIQNLNSSTVNELDVGLIDEQVSHWIARAKSNIQVMYQTALATSNHHDTDRLVERLLDLVFTWSSASRACVLLNDETNAVLIPKAFRRVDSNEIDSRPFEINEAVLGYVVRHQEGLLSPDLVNDPRFEDVSSKCNQTTEVICVPIRGRSGVRGLLYVDRAIELGELGNFNEEQFKLMIAIGHQSAVAIQNADYYQSLLDSERVAAVGNVMKALSHHIKNILQSINGGTHLIEDGLKKRNYDLVQNGWQIVQRNQDTMSNLVMDMLSYSKNRELNLKTVELNELVRSCIKLVERRAAYCGVNVEFKDDVQLEKVVVDRELFQRALHNILSTSINSCRDNSGGVVSVRLKRTEDGFVEIIVNDNGVGFSQSERDTLFDPLAINEFSYRTGIHMAVSKKIIEQHEGTITVRENQDENQGTVFLVRLPLRPEDPEVRQSVQTTILADAFENE